jgi:hypothetical protein
VIIRARLSFVATLALLFPLTTACSPSIGDATAEDGSDTGNDPSGAPTSGADGGEFSPCSDANACPDGQFCFNGICAIGCQSNGDCAADQFCDTEFDKLCHNKTVTTCPEVACPEGQECVNGFCSGSSEEAMCAQMPNGEDGCEKNALCIAESENSAKCYTFPACAEDDTCPVGTHGAVCNTGIIPSKGRICLVGLCTEATHCPSGDKCVTFEESGEIGACSAGAFGDLCHAAADCKSNNCFIAFPGEAGFCM